jgi:two-component system nitrogen regulation response regulator GlnG/two-component system response regulator HydG
MNPHDSTLPPATLTVEIHAEHATEIPALVVLWSRHEPHRVGEVLLVPAAVTDTPWVFGRGEADVGGWRLSLVRQRPGMTETTGPLECPRISRVQIRLYRRASGTLDIENAGRCPMAINGRTADGSALQPGDVLELKNELLLLCTTRPTRLPVMLDSGERHPFGDADAHGFVGESPEMWKLRGTVAAVAGRSVHVLIRGPSGSGKELVAHALHGSGGGARRPMVARNAATIPEGLLDAELFGNIRNYPNPGTPERPGLIGQAASGTLFLDEFAELPGSLQAHLLRVLDEGEYHRLGEATARRSDFRLIAATNRPESYLKHDVLARLKIQVTLPSLNERREDVPLLVTHLLRVHAAADPALAERFFPEASPSARPRVSPALVDALVRHQYTTNVRELEALLIVSTLESPGRYVELTDGVRRRLEAGSGARSEEATHDEFTKEERQRLDLQRRHRFRATECGRDPEYPGNRQTADLHVRQLVCKALSAAAWDVGKAAAILAGDGDDDLRARAQARIDTFLSNLERRLGGLAPDDARRALVEEWRGNPDALTKVLEALQKGSIRGRGAAEAADER